MADNPGNEPQATAKPPWSAALALAESVRERTRERPYSTLAAAAAVGYVLGGGLFSRSSARAIRRAFQIASIPTVREYLKGFAIGSIQEKTGSSPGEE